tara:strand:- start:537 stop:809 length:273 start_codon:yes stop_codon:yes gene_type:complete
MVFSCYLCEKESVYTTWFCDDCRKVKHIMNCYGKEGVLSILNKTCLRDNKQVGYKIDTIIKSNALKKIEETKKEIEKNEPMVLRKKKLQN